MFHARWIIVFMQALLFWLMVEDGMAKTLSREEVETLWEELLQKEQYKAIQFLNRRYSTPTSESPTDDKSILVQEGREGYLWGLLGLSEGGGWEIRGRLEAEVPIKEGILQLYSKATSEWAPGFAFIWMPGYDPKKYPIWEFRLLLRYPTNRREIHQLKSVNLGPSEVLPTFNPDGSSVKELIGQRVPRGELRYDETRHVAVIQILGVHNPLSVEVPLSQSSPPPQGKQQD